MTDARDGRKPGRVKTVRKKLADGTIKTYRYDLDARARMRFVASRSNGLHKLALLYFASPEFGALSARHQHAVRYYVALAEDHLGWMTLDDLQHRRARAEFYRLRDAHRDHPHKADRVVAIVASLLAWAYERGEIEWNHARGVEHLAPAAARAEITWSDDEIAAYLAVARADLAVAFQVALYTAARSADLVALRGEALRDGWLTFTPAKTTKSTGVVVSLPILELAPLAALLRDAPATGPLLVTHEGSPWTLATLKKWHYRAMAAAGIGDRHWHDLRGTAVSRMLAAGATEAEVAAITGHAIVQPGGMRSYAARSPALAVRAYRAWNRALEGSGEVVELRHGNRAGNRAANDR